MAIDRLYSKQMKIDDMEDKKLLTKKQREELQSLIDDVTYEAKQLRVDYEKNKSNMSGSMINIHENSPFLDVDDEGEFRYSGSRWRHVIKT
tara:strand:- start:334 stop:606 length:273 start_codon:yes stop_codon:yes gene_type:complete